MRRDKRENRGQQSAVSKYQQKGRREMYNFRSHCSSNFYALRSERGALRKDGILPFGLCSKHQGSSAALKIVRRISGAGIGMGGTCPSRARAAAVGGWYRDGHKWVHVQNTLVITDGCTDGLRGSGRMSTADVMVVYFDHRPHVRRKGHIQPNGD